MRRVLASLSAPSSLRFLRGAVDPPAPREGCRNPSRARSHEVRPGRLRSAPFFQPTVHESVSYVTPTFPGPSAFPKAVGALHFWSADGPVHRTPPVAARLPPGTSWPSGARKNRVIRLRCCTTLATRRDLMAPERHYILGHMLSGGLPLPCPFAQHRVQQPHRGNCHAKRPIPRAGGAAARITTPRCTCTVRACSSCSTSTVLQARRAGPLCTAPTPPLHRPSAMRQPRPDTARRPRTTVETALAAHTPTLAM